MANNKKVLTIDSLVTFKKLLEESGIGSGGSAVNLDDLEFKTINGQSIVGSGNISVQNEIELKTLNNQSLVGTGNIVIANASDLLAPAWLPNKQYIVGDLVSKDSKLYECTNNHYSDSTFNSNFWKETTIAENILGILNMEM